MKIQINGKVQELSESINVAELLVLNKVEMPDMVSVQLNGEFLKKEQYAAIALKENDEIDFLYFMGGGSTSLTIKKLKHSEHSRMKV